jgi:hypothetical protein
MNNTDGELVSQTVQFSVTTADTTPPTIDAVNYTATLDPTESSDSILILNFTASDPNLNDTTASAIVTNGISRSNTSCESTALGGNQTRYDCNINLAYYDPNGTWSINVSIADDSGNSAYNDSESFTYNQLNAFVLNTSTLSFGSMSIGENKTDQFYLNNTGNINLTTDISGTNLTNSTDQIDVSNLKWDLDSNPSDGTTITTSFATVGTLAIISIQDIWIELTIPTGTLPKEYSGTISLQS